MASLARIPQPDDRPRLVRRVRLQTDPISGGPVLLTQETVVLLNRTGHAVLSRCDGNKTLSQITAELETLYSSLSPALAQEVSAYLERLTEKGWVEWL
jgi:pyrroloquinoline quinone biosynthesis protein D